MRAKRYAYCDDRHSTMTTVEVITSVERRRRWSREEKLRIVAESAQPGRTTSQVARDHGIAPGQLFIWRRQLLSEAIANGVVGDGFAAVEIANGRLAAASPRLAMGGDRPIEIRLPNGIVIGVSEAVEVEALRRVLTALAGR
jgi:transposase